MNQIFKPKEFFKIPDGTLLSPFLNPKDSMSGLASGLVDGLCLAYGIVMKNTNSSF